ncbi:MAG: hypothetical protein HGB34_03835 [Candidatus Moranbacteria bacterium]|nr:hypothetical protein [Candidatus Moranbacteria bacterium]NTW76006.1 hypothetical protein [Candidatus Moranbacteria bacterium]
MVSEFLLRERGRLFLFAGFMLVGAIAFQAGFLKGSALAAKPLIIERPDVSGCPQGTVAGTSADASQVGVDSVKPGTSTTPVPGSGDCKLVGSRNSTLYHLPTCAPAKRIKPENRVCFSSEADAQAKGYKAGCMK